MSARVAFKPGQLAAELAWRGRSIAAFCKEVDLDRSTIDRANRGGALAPATYKKIGDWLAETPRVEAPEGLVEETA